MSDVRVALAVHDAPTRAGLRLALRAPGLHVTAEAATVEELHALTGAQDFDVALVAADLPGGGFAGLRAVSRGAPSAYTEAGPPERISPFGLRRRTSSTPTWCGRSSENTPHSRTRRAMSCEYCPP